MGYCGCGTKANKGRWLCIIVLAAIAIIFLIVNIALSSQCEECEITTVDGVSTKTCKDPDFDPDQDWDDIEGCSEGAIRATSLLFLIALVGSCIPCCCMCCCAHPPQKQMEVAIAAGPQQQVYGHPVAGQPAPPPPPGNGEPAYAGVTPYGQGTPDQKPAAAVI